jgi:hypothetical protein
MLHEENAKFKGIIDIQAQEILSIRDLVSQPKEQVCLLKSLHFGIKSEKLTTEDKKQASLFSDTGHGAET